MAAILPYFFLKLFEITSKYMKIQSIRENIKMQRNEFPKYLPKRDITLLYKDRNCYLCHNYCKSLKLAIWENTNKGFPL